MEQRGGAPPPQGKDNEARPVYGMGSRLRERQVQQELHSETVWVESWVESVGLFLHLCRTKPRFVPEHHQEQRRSAGDEDDPGQTRVV